MPALGVVGFGGREALVRSRSATHAEHVDQRVRRATFVISIRLSVANETFSEGSLAMGKHFGLAPAQMSALMGIDLVSRERRDRAAVDRLIASLDRPGDLAPVFGRLAAVRAHFDAHPADINALLDGMTKVQSDVAGEGRRSLDSALSAVFADASSNSLRRDLALLHSADDATIAVGVQLDALAQLVAPGDAAGRRASLTLLREGLTILKTVQDNVDFASPAQRESWRRINSSRASKIAQAEAERYAAMAPAQVPAPNIVAEAPALRAGMARLDDFNEFALAVARDTRSEAAELHRAARTHRNAALLLVASLVLAAIAFAALVSRSIVRPLRALAASAGRVSAGDLNTPLPHAAGPRELVEVRTTLGEVTDNLRLVEAQVDALAAARVADPVLDEPVPGRLGTLLHASVVGLSHSMAERERLAMQLAFDASHDALTGLPNRVSALIGLRRSIDRANATGTGLAVLLVDLDGFKRVNDTYGQSAGDTVLSITAERLRSHLREDDIVARLGGDEFALVVDAPNPGEVFACARRVIDALGEPIPVGSALTRVGASVGVAFLTDRRAAAEDLVRGAGLAADRAKQEGGGKVVAFDGAMYSELVHHAEVEAQLRDGLALGELLLHYQPVVTAMGLETVGAEALVRWQRNGALVPPNEFIPVAEASDLVIDIGRWVLHAACRQITTWQTGANPLPRHVAVNISRRHLLSLTVVDDVRSALLSTRADPSQLVVEITETALVDNFALAAHHLHALRALGVRIAIDDFGTGYTSLAHLRRLPADVIKLDRSLILAAQHPADERVVELVTGAAHALGMEIIAEGVETDVQLELVRRVGADLVQGFLIGRPLAPEAFERFDGRAVA